MEEFCKELDKGDGVSGRLDNFHGRHMCIVPKKPV